MVRFKTWGGSPVLMLLLVCLCVGCFIGFSGCGSSGKPDHRADELAGAHLERAERLFSDLEQGHAAGRDADVLIIADTLLAQYPTFAHNDEVLALAAESAFKSGKGQRSLDLTDQLLVRYPHSGNIVAALTQAVGVATARNDSLRAAGYLVALYDQDPTGQTGPDGLPVATEYLRGLSAEQLSVLATGRPGSSLRPYLSYLQVERLLVAGRTNEAEAQVLSLETQAPGGTWTLAARDLLEGGPGILGAKIAGPVRPDLVGVICPLTGRYAVLGNAFYDGALLALEVTNSQLGTSFEFQVADSQADPVTGALAARKFCRDEGSIALLGAMMSDPTAAVALVADRWQVPLVSPTATNERLWELGEGVFQTNLTGIFETRLLASLATTVMLKKRFALLYPNTDEGRGYAEVFRSEVEALGGQIVAEEAFPARGTDFKDPIQAVRRKRPEVLFVPASVDQMVLLGPQLDFYHAGSLILGLSNWNSEKLGERSGTVLERAIFPNDVALFPDEWTSEFRSRWNGENYPREATDLALKSFQATRMLLDTLAGSQAVSRDQLTRSLRRRLASRDFEAEGLDSFAGTVRMFRSEKIVPFPGGRFAEAWSLTEGALPDSVSIPDDENLPEDGTN